MGIRRGDAQCPMFLRSAAGACTGARKGITRPAPCVMFTSAPGKSDESIKGRKIHGWDGMTDHCSLCGAPFHRGKGSNIGSCSVCSVEICIRCSKFTFCPRHFQALSPCGQSTVKIVYRAAWILPICLIILIIYLGGGPLHEVFPPPLGLLAIFTVIGVPIWKKNSWLKSIWLRDLGCLEQPYAIWKCKACGFENPAITHACGQCNQSRDRVV